ncbi:MAG: diacylglycerol kinase [Acidimicrobiales bacterium]|nr:MAG: diacylglycerol kinase [Acidimicrobiales bacterium]
MRLLLIVNRHASTVNVRLSTFVQRALEAEHQVEVVATRGRDHATELARQGGDAGVDVVIVLGGDGTVNEAANGLIGTGTALAAVPAGSTNVFARTLGLSKEPRKATTQLLSALRQNSRRRVGLGQVNDRYFLFHVGLGFDASVVEQVEKRAELKRHAGQLAFVYCAFLTWFRHYDRSGPRMAIQAGDDGEKEAYFAICLKTNPYTFLGRRRLNLAPDIRPHQGLAMVRFDTMSFAPVIGLVASALGSGGWIQRHPKVGCRADLDRIQVRAIGTPVAYQVDGEFLGEGERLVITHHPDVLEVMVP